MSPQHASAGSNTDPTRAIRDSILKSVKPLTGHVYVLDPGHGGITEKGRDTGTKREWPSGQTGKNKTYLYEDQFTLGLTIEMKRKIEELGGIVITTVDIPDSVAYVPFGANRIPAQGAEYFNLRQPTPIVSGKKGMMNRLKVGQRVVAEYPNHKVHWISSHFDWLGSAKNKSLIPGTRIFDSEETRDTTFVKVKRLVTKKTKVNGKRVKQKVWETADSVVSIQPSGFVMDLAQAFYDAGWLRDQSQRPVIASGKVRYLYIIHGARDKKFKGKNWQKVFNKVFDRVLIEYAYFNNQADWERLQQPDGSLERLAEITVKGLVKHAQREEVQRSR